MMKKNLYVLLILSMVGFILLNIASAKDEPDLFKMASILEDENMIIHKWSLNAREILETVQTKQEAENKVNQLKKQFPNWDWSLSKRMKSGKRKLFLHQRKMSMKAFVFCRLSQKLRFKHISCTK